MYKGRILKRVLSLVISMFLVLSLMPSSLFGDIVAAQEASVREGTLTENITSDERKIKINDNWRFCLLSKAREMDNSLDETANKADYAESGTWNTVQLPHDWSIYQEFTDSEARAAQGSLPGGTGWYRKTFTLSNDMKDKNIVLQFDAVQMVSQVWINGVDLGKQYLGYVTFEYDITEYLKFDGEENVIAVKAYSSRESARWYSGAGIYGSVYLIATDKIHVPVNGIHVATVVKEDGKYMQPDFHTEPDIEALKQKSTVNVRTNVENKTAQDAQVTVRSTIYSKVDANVAQAESTLEIPAAADGEEANRKSVDQIIEIENPALWSPDEPNLYWVKTEIIQGGKVIDTMDTRFGIRYLYLQPGSYDAPYSESNTIGGLFINGEYTRVNGVCEHRDLGALGMETYQAAIDRRIRKLKDMGVNVVRCAHNPVSPEYIEAADRLGMLVFEEGFDQWLKAKNKDDYHNYFNKAADGTTVVFEYSAADGSDTHIEWRNTELEPNCVRDIQAMVDRDKNSPAIFLWSTGNEIYDTSDGHGMDTQWLLSAAIKEIDSLDNISWRNVVDTDTKRTIRPEPEENYAALPSEENNYTTDYTVRGGGTGNETYGARYGRPISAAPPTWDTDYEKVERDNGFIDNMALADIGGHNYSNAYGQYNTHKTRYPNASVVGTETVSAFYTRGVYNIEDYRGSDEVGRRWAHASGYASEWPYNRNFVTASVSIREHRDDMMPFLFGEMVWTGHDYLGEPTPHGSPSRSSYFGIIDTAGFEKDAFYMYRSAWTDIPTVHLLPQKWNWDSGTQVPIMVYTNAASVEVFINGKSIGEKEYDKKTAKPVYLDYGKHLYQAGELKAVAKDAEGNIIAEDVVYTAGEARSIVLSGEKAFIKNDGQDLLYVEAEIVDSAGNMVPTADNRITFHVVGGEIVALDNGDPRDREPFRGLNNNNNSNTSNSRKAFNGKALAIIKAQSGAENIIVTASGSQLKSNMLTVQTMEEVGDGTNVSSYTLSEITTGVGVAPELPNTIGIIYDDGLIKECAIDSWEDVDKVNLRTPGSYTVYAVSDELEDRVETKVHVKEIASIEAVEVTTITGVAPMLPNFATLHYADGEIGSAQVAWDEIKPSLYAEEGIFDVSGTIGQETTVEAEVTVKAISSIKEIAVSTERGILPEMPSTVEVEFTDGSKEQIGVSWDISGDKVRSIGLKKIVGTVLSSEIEAIAWLNVSMVTYASDMEYEADSNKVFKDSMSNGESLQARGMQGGPGETYEKGFGTKAPAEIVIDIKDKGYTRFRSYVNLSLLKGGVVAPGTVAFKVYLDDETEPAFSSGDMDRTNEAALIDIDVTGKSKIRLVTESKSGVADDDLADWVNARFLSEGVVIDEILTPRLYTANANEAPELPDTIQAMVSGVKDPVEFNVEWLTSVSDEMFVSGSVQKVYGRLEGAENGLVMLTYMVNYGEACKKEGFLDKIGSWSVTENFDYASIAKGEKVHFGDINLAPRLIYSGTSNMLIENVKNYGFEYGAYPEPNGGSESVVFATPDLSYFQLKNVAENDTATNNSFSFETSTDGETWTEFTAFTKGDIIENTGTKDIWSQRTYTSNDDAEFPAGTNFLCVKYPSGNTWQYNMTQIVLKGGSGAEEGVDTDMISFAIGEYNGVIDQEAGTVLLTVPKSLDVTATEPEITVLPGASVSPEGPQDFTNPVTYTVTSGSKQKQYSVTVKKGVEVSFHPYGGTLNGSKKELVRFISVGSSVAVPENPKREGYLFDGWTMDLESQKEVRIRNMRFEEDTVFYALWSPDPSITIEAEADATVKTYQSEKQTNYGTDDAYILRQTSDTASHGQFGETFTVTDTSDSTDMKTAYIRFDTKELENCNIKRIRSVKLVLSYTGNGNPRGTNDIKILATQAENDWKEGSITWNKRPALLNPQDVVESGQFTATQNGSATVELDVTGFYKDLEDGETKITFAVVVNSSARDFYVASKENADLTKAPKLVFETVKNTDYMVTYDLNGGEGSIPIQEPLYRGNVFTAAKGTGITAPAGKEFAGWNTKKDGSGTSYYAGDEIVMPAGNLELYALYKAPVTITANNKTVKVSGNTLDLSKQGLFGVDENAGDTHTYSVLSGGTGKGRVDKTDGKTLTISEFGTIRIKLVTSETDTHMKGTAIAVLTLEEGEQNPITKIEVAEKEKTVKVGETYQIQAEPYPSETSDDTKLTYESDNEDAATVDENGVVTAVAKGTANITISCVRDDVTATVKILVTEDPNDSKKQITDITVEEQEKTLKAGETYQIEAMAYPADAEEDTTLTYHSKNNAVATVDANGLVTAAAEGETEIIISCVREGITATVKIIVTKADDESIASPEDQQKLQTELSNLINIYQDLSKYSDVSVAAFQKALADAQKVLSNPNATTAQVKKALDDLAKAEKGLTSIQIPDPLPEKGFEFQSGDLQYQVIKSDAQNGEVAFVKGQKAKGKMVIPSTVQYKEYTFKVTEIGKEAFQKNKKLKEIIFGENIAKIGAKSFFKCSKLKKITFMGEKAPKVESKAFTGIKKNAKITVPKKTSKKMLKKFKTAMKSAGKKVSVKKAKK